MKVSLRDKIRIGKSKGITKEEMELLRRIDERPRARYKKQHATVYTCKDCGQEHYYKISRCIFCGRSNFTVKKHSLSNPKDDDI